MMTTAWNYSIKGDSMDNSWLIEDNSLDPSKKQSLAAKFTLCNGYIGCRGFFDEDIDGIDGLGGIYIAGLFNNKEDDILELVNAPNFLYTPININDQKLDCYHDNIADYRRYIDMHHVVSCRNYTHLGRAGQKVNFKFQRFVSLHDLHMAGQKVEILSPDKDVEIDIVLGINADISNLNMVSTEPLPVQPGRVHLRTTRQDDDMIEAETKNTCIKIAMGQKIVAKASNTEKIKYELISQNGLAGRRYRFIAHKGIAYVFHKIIYCYTSLDTSQPYKCLKTKIRNEFDYDKLFNRHIAKSKEFWDSSDIRIEGNIKDQRAIRYSVFHLFQAAPSVVKDVSIGARGLTGEMYGGAVFWDTEIFMLPFYILNWPDIAKDLLKWRYITLEQSKLNAEQLWFKGAKYAWEAGQTGRENTPVNGGAFYAVHIVADIAYTIDKYLICTDDYDYLCEQGLEILIETSRFWVSRANYDTSLNGWSIMAVRGPNEYDNIVNNNLYTNLMAKENLLAACKWIEYVKLNMSQNFQEIICKTKLRQDEPNKWAEIAELLHVPYDKDKDLHLEDESYHRRMNLDLKRAKPTQKRIVESTLPYEALTLYQVTKQSDIAALINLLPQHFTEKQKLNAWNYYEPRTVHDSSLSYGPYCILAARLGLNQKAIDYFRQSAYIDLDDLKLNNVSGLHFANFGSTWQAVVFGFAGLQLFENHIKINPNVPEEWGMIEFCIFYKGWLLYILAKNNMVEVSPQKKGCCKLLIELPNEKIWLS